MSAKRTSPLSGWPVAVIMLTAFVVVIPFLFLGDPSGHDFEFHMNSWMEVVTHWNHGIVYPGWAGLAHYGYGEARFIFYPPFSWTLGGLLGALLPWRIVSGTYVFLALALSGMSMFSLARRWMSRNDALFAACLYAANPYHLVIVYWRSAYAELLAAALLPLLLLFLLRLEDNVIAPGKSANPTTLMNPLALIVAGAWLTNIPTAIMLNYSLMLFIVATTIHRRSLRVFLVGILAITIGSCLAGFYLLPAIYEQRWVNISQVLSPGVRPVDNFLFTHISDADHNRFNLLISIVAVCEIIVLAIAVLRSWRKCLVQSVWKYAALWSLVSTIIMLPLSSAAWKYLPELKFMQFPWRWLLCLNVGFAMIVTLACKHWASRLAVCAIMLLALGLVWHRVQQPWWDNAADIAEMLDNQQSGDGYDGTDEYVPSGADASEIAQNSPLVTVEGDPTAQVQIEQWSAESKLLKVNADRPGNILLRLFNYPAWKVKVNGRVTLTESNQVEGQMIIPVQAGPTTVKIEFKKTWDRSVGMLISFLTLAFLALLFVRSGFASEVHTSKLTNV